MICHARVTNYQCIDLPSNIQALIIHINNEKWKLVKTYNDHLEIHNKYDSLKNSNLCQYIMSLLF